MIHTVPCPNCGEKLSLALVQPSFQCPRCHTNLRSNSQGALFCAILFGGVPFLAAPAFGSDGVGLASVTVASALFTFAIWRLIVTVAVNE